MKSPEQKREYMRRWHAANRERVLKVRKAYYDRTVDVRRLQRREEFLRNGNKPHRVAKRKEAAKRRRLANPEKYRIAKQVWAKKNPGYAKRWHAKHPGRQTEYLARQKAKNPERFKELHRAAYHRRRDKHAARAKIYRQIHKARIYETTKQWVQNNPDKVRANRHRNRHLMARWAKEHPERIREHSNRRRARKSAAGCEDCSEKIAILNRARFCHYCCAPLTKENRAIDHVTPLARGGKHCPDNLVASCRSCNSSKGKKLVHEWTWKEAA